jgi:hypothetical protein
MGNFVATVLGFQVTEKTITVSLFYRLGKAKVKAIAHPVRFPPARL